MFLREINLAKENRILRESIRAWLQVVVFKKKSSSINWKDCWMTARHWREEKKIFEWSMLSSSTKFIISRVSDEFILENAECLHYFIWTVISFKLLNFLQSFSTNEIVWKWLGMDNGVKNTDWYRDINNACCLPFFACSHFLWWILFCMECRRFKQTQYNCLNSSSALLMRQHIFFLHHHHSWAEKEKKIQWYMCMRRTSD